MQQPELFKLSSRKRPKKTTPCEWKIVPMRECVWPYGVDVCDRPAHAVEYWHRNVATAPHYNPECECFVVLLLNSRRYIIGHHLVTIGLLDSVLVHAREVYRAAIIGAAHAVILMHNHPSGIAIPSDADIQVTRELIRAGQLLKIEVCDHIIVGRGQSQSLREYGCFNV